MPRGDKFEKDFQELKDKNKEAMTLGQLLIKLLNYLSAVMMVGIACYRIWTFQSKDGYSQFYLTISVYLFLFALAVAMAETEAIVMQKYFEFLISDTGKGFFICLIGLLIFDKKNQFDLVMSATIATIGLFNMILGCCTTKVQRKKDPEPRIVKK